MKGQIDYLVSRQAPSSLTHLIELFIIGRLTKSEGTRQRSARARFKIGFAATVDNFWKPTHSKKKSSHTKQMAFEARSKVYSRSWKIVKTLRGTSQKQQLREMQPAKLIVTISLHRRGIFWVAYLKLILWSPRISLVFEGFNMRCLNQAWTQY